MRKFLIAICGMCMVAGAFAHPDRYSEPNTDAQTFAQDWNTSGSYSTDLPTTDNGIYPATNYLNIYACAHDESTGKEKNATKYCYVTNANDTGIAGTYDDEGAIVLDIAQEIYQNGAKFCTTQVQVANRNGREYVWIDYYSDKNKYPCKTYCKPGYDPDNSCAPYTESICQEVTGYPLIYPKGLNTFMRSGGSTGKFTTTMQVFGFKNETGSGESNKPAGARTTKHIVLGIISKDVKDGNGIKVAPIEITGKRDKTGSAGIQSWVYSVKHNGKITTLCPQGYAPDSNGVCKISTTCTEAIEEAARVMCQNYTTDYTPDVHELQWKRESDCWEYKCKLSGYGFKSETDKTCVQCGTGVRSGVLRSTHVCTTCDVGQCFKHGACQQTCTEIPKLKIERGPNYDSQNRECWRETSPAKFWGCVMCTNKDDCYRKNSSGTYGCHACPTE